MTLRLHDTLSGETRPFVPLRDDRVGVYSCGPTVYGPAHIGNFRSFLFADLLVRYLRYQGLRVTWVMNVTDIDDRIIERANAAGETTADLTDRWLARFKADFAAVRMTTPDARRLESLVKPLSPRNSSRPFQTPISAFDLLPLQPLGGRRSFVPCLWKRSEIFP